MSARDDLLAWITDERDLYAHCTDGKWSSAAAEAAHLSAVRCDGPTTWHDWAGNYIKRAAMFGLDTPQGRQAAGKAIVTLMHVLETATEIYGPMPRAGVPSGDIVEQPA